MKNIKIYFNKINSLDKNFFPFKVLFENFNVEIVDDYDKADVIFEMVWRDGDYRTLKMKKKTILITSEDLYSRRELFGFIESMVNWFGFKKKKYKIMDFLDSIIPYRISKFPLYYFFSTYIDFIRHVEKRHIKNAYAIIQNDIHGENIFVLPYFIQEYYYRIKDLRKKKIINPRKKFCAFIVTSNSSRERVKFFKKLSKYKKIDSYGKVMNNISDNSIINWRDNGLLFKDYKFVICFENSFSKEYITEKLPNVMFANSIPIYRGAPNIGKYFNTKSFINYGDCGSYDKMINKIIELDQDDNKYISFLKQPWFKDNKIPQIIKDKEGELIKFYKKIFDS